MSVSLCALAPAAATAQETRDVDILIRGGEVYTGEDQSPFIGDVAVKDDKIVFIGKAQPGAFHARETIDATGLVVLPGLIDAHTHPDTYIRSPDPQARLNAPWLMQGVTTVFIGVDGGGRSPLLGLEFGTPDVREEASELEARRIGTNIVSYVGFGAVRERVLRNDDRAPTPAELDRMKGLVAKGMCEGAIGFSTGLFYAPQSFASTEEVIALAKEAAKRGGIYDTHQRDESSYTIGLINSVKETIRIGREARMPIHFAHLKALGVDVHGKAPEIISLIDQARAEGLEVTADQYPWLASGTGLEAALVPRWAVDGGLQAMIKRFDDPELASRIRAEMRENLRRRGGADAILLTSNNKIWTGKRLSAVAQEWKLTPEDAAIRILRDSPRTSIASFNMTQSDVDQIMQQPWVVTSSDGSGGHPRQYATFPEKYRKYVAERPVISFRQFVRQSTGKTADIFRLDRRGYLRPGYFADVAVIDLTKYRPRADYVHPRVLSDGVQDLMVNGQLVIHDAKLTGAAPGRALLHAPTAGTCP